MKNPLKSTVVTLLCVFCLLFATVWAYCPNQTARGAVAAGEAFFGQSLSEIREHNQLKCGGFINTSEDGYYLEMTDRQDRVPVMMIYALPPDELTTISAEEMPEAIKRRFIANPRNYNPVYDAPELSDVGSYTLDYAGTPVSVMQMQIEGVPALLAHAPGPQDGRLLFYFQSAGGLDPAEAHSEMERKLTTLLEKVELSALYVGMARMGQDKEGQKQLEKQWRENKEKQGEFNLLSALRQWWLIIVILVLAGAAVWRTYWP